MREMSVPRETGNSWAGSRPEGARDEREAARQVREMFSRIAPRYDLLNHLLSFSVDRLWRRRVARRYRTLLARPEARVVDLCCGTGDLTLALARRGLARVVGSDFAHPMLERAREKSRSLGAGRDAGCARATFAEADALRLPFADASFDLATAAFGFRNLANYEQGLSEIYRVLRPGGEVALLEFAEPAGAVFGRVYRFYFRRILPRLGGVISGSDAAYSYLPNSVLRFPSPRDLAEQMRRSGFAEVRCELWTRGIVVLHTGRRARVEGRAG